MKLTRASSYALHAVAYMVVAKPTDPVASHAIAKSRGIPERFLLKVLKPLVAARVLHSIKGPNGGYKLARPANDVTMLDVVEAVDGPIRGHAPLTQMEADGTLDKKLEAICNNSADQLRKALGKLKVVDLAGK